MNYKIKYGIAGGIISSILGTLNWLVIARPIGVVASQLVGYLSITLSLLCIPIGIRYFRDKLNAGKVSFIQGIKIGLGITCMAGLVMAIHSMLFFLFQKDEFIEWQKKGLDESALIAYNEQLAQMPDFAFAPWFQAIIMFTMVFLIGAAINLISSVVLKKD